MLSGTVLFGYFYGRSFVGDSIEEALEEYDATHRRDVRLCRPAELATCSSPGECQRVECLKFRDITAPRCQILPDVSLDGDACDDEDPDTTASVCVRGICEGTAFATSAPTIAPVPPLGGDAIRPCNVTEAASCPSPVHCSQMLCRIIADQSAEPVCYDLPDSSLNGNPCDDGDPDTPSSACFNGLCYGTPAPTTQPTKQPTFAPTRQPTKQPTLAPTKQPSSAPTFQPTPHPTFDSIRPCTTIEAAQCPVSIQCNQMNCQIADGQTTEPICSQVPNVTANGESCEDYDASTPSSVCTNGLCGGTPAPTTSPTARPTASPTAQPTKLPTASPTKLPTAPPTKMPTASPTVQPTPQPTIEPSRECNATEQAMCDANEAAPCRVVTCGYFEVLGVRCIDTANFTANGEVCDDGSVHTSLSVCHRGECRADVTRACDPTEFQTHCGSLSPSSVCLQVACVILPSGVPLCADHANYSTNGLACDYDGGYVDTTPRSKCHNGQCVPLQTTPCDPSARNSTVRIFAGGSTAGVLFVDSGKLVLWGSSTTTGYGIGQQSGGTLVTKPHVFGYVPVTNLTIDGDYLRVEEITIAQTFACVRLNNSRVLCWGIGGAAGGQGSSSSLATGGGQYPTIYSIPYVRIHSENGTQLLAKKLSVGSTAQQFCAVLMNDRLKCWGVGASGQLGYGNTATIGDDETPDSVTNYSYIPTSNGTVVSVFTASLTTCAITAHPERALYCWGSNTNGQLGLGDTTLRNIATSPVNITLDGDYPRTAALSVLSTCVIMELSRDVKCWGSGANGQLGQNSTSNLGQLPSTIPALNPPIAGIVSAADYAAGVRPESICAGDAFYCVLLNNTKVKCWGVNTEGQLGVGTTTAVGNSPANSLQNSGYSRILSPQEEALGIHVSEIACTQSAVCAKLSNNQVKCWGGAGVGQLGYGDLRTRGASNTSTADNYGYVSFRPFDSSADTACSCVCVQPNTSDASLLDNFLVDTTGVECPVVPTPVGTPYCPSPTYTDPRCVCDDVIQSPAPTRSPTTSPTRFPTMSPTASPTFLPTLSPTLSPVPAPP